MVCAASRLFSFKKTWKKDSENRLIIRMRISRCTGSIARAPWCQLPLCSSPARLARCNFQSIQKTKKTTKKDHFPHLRVIITRQFILLMDYLTATAAWLLWTVAAFTAIRSACSAPYSSVLDEALVKEAFVFGLHSRAPRRFIQQYVRPHTKSIPVVSKCNERKGQVLGCTQAHGPGRPQ